MKYILSVDNGGTYIKAGVYDAQGRQIALVKRYNHLITPAPGWTEYDPDELWETNCLCMRAAIEQSGLSPEQIAVIGISAQGSGCYFMGEGGATVRNVISSSDHRALVYSERWQADGTDRRQYERIYRDSAPGQTNAILAWMKDHEPENYARIRWVFCMKDYLVYRFTGNIINSYGCMSSTGLMDLGTRTYEAELARAYGIPEVMDKLGSLRWDLEIGGTLTAEAAAACGCAPGTPVACGCHDVIATALAMGITDSRYCFTIMGTCAINAYISPNPVLSGALRYNEIFAFPDMFLLEEPGFASSSVLEWVIDALFDRDRLAPSEIYGQINRIVASVDPGACNLIFLPSLRGNDVSSAARGAWIGLEPEHGLAELLAAVYEGVVFSHMLQLETLFSTRERPERIRAGGGATNSAVWMQLFADALGIPVEIIPGAEMGAKGAAIAAAAASGIHPDLETAIRNMVQPGQILRPRPELSGIYAQKFARFKAVMEGLNPLWPLFSRSNPAVKAADSSNLTLGSGGK